MTPPALADGARPPTPSAVGPPEGVVAAVDHRVAAAPVLRVARRLGACLDRPVTVVHVEEDPARRAAATAQAAHAGLPITVLSGVVGDALAQAVAEGDVDVLVLGAAGSRSSRTRLGHVADALVHQAPQLPLLLVPPTGDVRDRPIQRVLRPLDRDVRATRASAPFAERFRSAGCEVTGLHVVEDRTVPTQLDHPGHGTTSWRGEFARRHGMADVELRRGTPGRRIVEAAQDQDVDLVLLAWSRVLDERRGQVVAQVLADCEVPVLVVPVTGTAAEETT